MAPPTLQSPVTTKAWKALTLQANEKTVVDPSKTSFLGSNFKDQPLLYRINYLHSVLLISTPLLGLYGVLTCEHQLNTWIWAVVYYFITGLGITAGYHRYFAHRGYDVGPIMEGVLTCMGSGAVEGSIKWWSRDHRAHHRYVDTPKDPYPATLGFWHSHIGWMLIKQDKSKIGRADITDLNDKWIVRFQHKYYAFFALIFGFIVPAVVAGLCWGDWKGGFLIAGIGRLVFVHHSTFCVNSLAHYAGSSTFTDGNTAKDSLITALVTLGEGLHSYHHTFPSDYRNGVEWWQYDPTKWFIRALSWVGLTFNLRRSPDNEIQKCKIQMKAKHLHEEASKIYWGPDPSVLPTYTMEEVEKRVEKQNKKWVVLDGFVIDVLDFAPEHPGGEKILKLEYGKDITAKFRGEVYKHSSAGHNIAHNLRVGRIVSEEDKKNA